MKHLCTIKKNFLVFFLLSLVFTTNNLKATTNYKPSEIAQIITAVLRTPLGIATNLQADNSSKKAIFLKLFTDIVRISNNTLTLFNHQEDKVHYILPWIASDIYNTISHYLQLFSQSKKNNNLSDQLALDSTKAQQEQSEKEITSISFTSATSLKKIAKIFLPILEGYTSCASALKTKTSLKDSFYRNRLNGLSSLSHLGSKFLNSKKDTFEEKITTILFAIHLLKVINDFIETPPSDYELQSTQMDHQGLSNEERRQIDGRLEYFLRRNNDRQENFLPQRWDGLEYLIQQRDVSQDNLTQQRNEDDRIRNNQLETADLNTSLWPERRVSFTERTDSTENPITSAVNITNVGSSGFENQTTCCICLEDYLPGERVTVLGCHHVLHTDCHNNGLQSGHCALCSACRQPRQANGEDIVTIPRQNS